MRYPRISVVTPSYNQAVFLERTIQSILNQDYPNLEYIIIDGGSSDGSLEIIRRYSSHLAYWESQTDYGQANAINKGFCHATGDIFSWINSDDIFMPLALRRVAEHFQDPSVDLVYGQRGVIDEADRLVSEELVVTQDPFGYLFYGLRSLNQEACFWRSSLHHKVGGLNEGFQCALDYEFFLRLCWLARGRTLLVHDFLSCFRLHSGQKSRNADAARLVNCFAEQRHARKEFMTSHGINQFDLFVHSAQFLLLEFVRTYGWRGFLVRFRPSSWFRTILRTALK